VRRFKEQTVTLSVTRLLIAVAALMLISVANLVFTLLQSEDIGDVKADTETIRTYVLPICLAPGTEQACKRQVDAADRQAVVRLCRIVHDELDLPIPMCDLPQFSGGDHHGGSQQRQSGDTASEGSSDTASVDVPSGTNPGDDGGGPNGGGPPDDPGTPPDDPGDDPGTDPPDDPGPGPPEEPPGQSGIGAGAGACVGKLCAGADVNLGGGNGIGIGANLGDAHLRIQLPQTP